MHAALDYVYTFTGICTCSFLLCIPHGQTREPLHGLAFEAGLVSAEYLELADSQFSKRPSGDIDGLRFIFSAQVQLDEKRMLSIGHEYNGLDIATLASASPTTNGDLHTLHAAMHWRTELKSGELGLAFAPALSASSNAFKNPHEIDGEAFQVWASAIYTTPASWGDWIIGAAHDYRLGDSRTYPVIGWHWQKTDSLVRLTWPDLLLQRQFKSNWFVRFTNSPDGNEWEAYDRQLEQHSNFRREAWQSEIRVGKKIGRQFDVALLAGYHWNQRWQFTRMDGATRRTDSDNGHYLGLHLAWHIGKEYSDR